MDLFGGTESASTAADPRRMPLAARMRPRSLDEIVGQDGILGPGKLLRRAIEADRLGSVILFGPPGSGKTSLAEVIACVSRRHFERASGVVANVAALRGAVEQARLRRHREGVETILFVDEIHRFNKAQQDVLLPHVEEGAVTLIGATTHNPQFFINGPLVSRSLVFELAPLGVDDLLALLRRALDDPRGLADHAVSADESALRHLAEACEGDARRALNALETAVLSTPPGPDGRICLTPEVAADSVQRRMLAYDRDEDGHYDTISAFIKSVRGSDPHAAVYWLAKMLHAGEDPRFIARRLVILASEDIGNADPRGLTLAVAAMQAVEFVGMPEARIVLAQATTYLATAPKSNAAYLAVDNASRDVREGHVIQVPNRLRNVGLRVDGSARVDEGGTYLYPHDYAGHFVDQEYLPTDDRYYLPGEQGYEGTIRRRMEGWGRLAHEDRSRTGQSA